MPRDTSQYDRIPKEHRYREMVRAIEKAHYLAQKDNRSFLVYLLSMARLEASNSSSPEES